MANAIIIQAGSIALDPDSVARLDKTIPASLAKGKVPAGSGVAYLTSGESILLSPSDFAALWAVKTGQHNNG